ncbi:MAG: SPOR domain-containing protein [Spirochaetales bacterium]|nr:SPOR domain-containing protein [Spirochaetales bacterium]
MVKNRFIIAGFLMFSLVNAFSYAHTKEIELKIKWLDSNIDSPYFYDKLIQTYKLVPDTQASIDLLIDYVNLIQDQSQKHGVFRKIAALSELSGSIEQAQRYYQVAYFSAPNNSDFESLFFSSYLLFQMGEFSESIKQLEIIIAKSNSVLLVPKSKLLLSMVYFLNEDLDKSKEFFYQAVTLYNKSHSPFYYVQNSFINWYNFNSSFLKVEKLSLEYDLEIFSSNRYQSMLSFAEFLIFQLNFSQTTNRESTEPGVEIEEGQLLIQVASYTNKANADVMVEKLKSYGFMVASSQKVINNTLYHRIYVIPDDQNNVAKTIMKLKEHNIEGFLVN